METDERTKKQWKIGYYQVVVMLYLFMVFVLLRLINHLLTGYNDIILALNELPIILQLIVYVALGIALFVMLPIQFMHATRIVFYEPMKEVSE